MDLDKPNFFPYSKLSAETSRKDRSVYTVQKKSRRSLQNRPQKVVEKLQRVALALDGQREDRQFRWSKRPSRQPGTQ